VAEQQDLRLLLLFRATKQMQQLEEATQYPIGERKVLKQQRPNTHARKLRRECHVKSRPVGAVLVRRDPEADSERLSSWDPQG